MFEVADFGGVGRGLFLLKPDILLLAPVGIVDPELAADLDGVRGDHPLHHGALMPDLTKDNANDAAGGCWRRREDLDFLLHTEGVRVGNPGGLRQGFQDQFRVRALKDLLLLGRGGDLNEGVVLDLDLYEGRAGIKHRLAIIVLRGIRHGPVR